ncbi:hypothetical protein SAMN05444583_10148 [Rhodococcus maanshanensis]|uniref:Uncharacterized protein n=1 Tax=Rhodococcus maanshanensis TaxID=183556 RepID=A0A1H7F8D4_9NOCA|nr:hypothetical protein SAMN05444583_10148 [Rhodococcus maanshanensis]
MLGNAIALRTTVGTLIAPWHILGTLRGLTTTKDRPEILSDLPFVEWS